MRSGVDHTVLPANHTTPAFTAYSSPEGATTEWTVIAPAVEAYYSLIDPVRMKGWVVLVGWGYSGRFTHINGYPSAAGQVQASESLPVRDRRSTTEPPNQQCASQMCFSDRRRGGSGGKVPYIIPLGVLVQSFCDRTLFLACKQWKTSTVRLKVNNRGTRNQWSLQSSDVMCSDFLAKNTSCEAVFIIDCTICWADCLWYVCITVAKHAILATAFSYSAQH